jgi:hypothetical protein
MCNGSEVSYVGYNKRVLHFSSSQKQWVDNIAFRNQEFAKVFFPEFI